MKNNKYEELYILFSTYREKDWFDLLSDIMDLKPLMLPYSIDNGLREETLVFIYRLLSEKNTDKSDFYSKQLADYYTTLLHTENNYKKFLILNWVFSEIKPIKYRFALENKFTKEEFLHEYNGQDGENLQIDLLSTLSNLRYVENNTINDYLSNRYKIYSLDSFILVSLRYFQKTNNFYEYTNYLNQLINSKLTEENAAIFLESFKELVFQKKSYTFVYEWLVYLNSLNEDKFRIFREEMRKWINYDNIDLDINNHHCFPEFIFFELNKDNIIPCHTIKKLARYSNQHQEAFERVKRYLCKDSLNMDGLIKQNQYYQGYTPYRILENNLIYDPTRIEKEVLIRQSEIYKLSEFQILCANLSEEEYEILTNSISNKEENFAA